MYSTSSDLTASCKLNVASGVGAGSPVAMEELYVLIKACLLPTMKRHLGPDLYQDGLHDVFVEVVEGIRRGALSQHESLGSFLFVIGKRYTIDSIHRLSKTRSTMTTTDRQTKETIAALTVTDTPETIHQDTERNDLTAEAMAQLSTLDQDVLRRFYLLEQPADQIQNELNMTPTQFRLLKCRAKARLGTERRRLQIRKDLECTAQPKAHTCSKRKYGAF